MADGNILDFNAQAVQMLGMVERRDKESATRFLRLKFKSLYEQGVIAGRIYEKEGKSPFLPTE